MYITYMYMYVPINEESDYEKCQGLIIEGTG